MPLVLNSAATDPKVLSRKKAPLPAKKGFAGGFWDLQRHGVTASAANTFLNNPEEFRLQYIEGWSGRNTGEALDYGTCVHWILEQIYKQRKWPSERTLRELILDYEAHWNTIVVSPTQDQLDQQQKVLGMAHAVLPAYFKRWDGDITGRYSYKHSGVYPPKKWIALEEEFSYPYVYSDGFTVPLRGRIDGVFLNDKGRVFVFDTKTKGQIREEMLSHTLKMDFQMMLYFYVATQKYGAEFGKPLGVIMNIVRRSQLKQGKQSLIDFLDRIMRDASDEARFDHYFLRFQSIVGQNELAKWVETRLHPTMDSIRGWYEGRYPHVPVDKNLGTYGPSPLFYAVLDGDFTQCYKRSVVFPELPEVK